MRRRWLWLIVFLISSSWRSRADELRLKDGTKIVGSIVGFEENSFKVRTNFGFAVVLKDQVASISIGEAGNPAPTEATPISKDRGAEKPAKTPSASPKAAAQTDGLSTPPDPTAKTSAASNRPAAAQAEAASTTAPPAANSNSAVRPAPLPPAAPEPIREQVVGNTYTNETYHFQMYKPPAWQVISGGPSLLPGAVAAMGTGDQTTYLLVGQEVTGRSLESARDSTERRLRDILENFRPMGESRTTISAASAIEIRFRGRVEEHDWSGVAAFVSHGRYLFTIFGMTLADSDLVQIQENVIARAISSLQFTE